MVTIINPSGQTLTQYNTQSGGASNLNNNVSTGTTGQVLTSNGSSAQPTFQALGIGTLMQTTSAAIVNGGVVTGLASFNLPAGTWLISANGVFESDSANISAGYLGISTSNSAFQGNYADQKVYVAPAVALFSAFTLNIVDFKVVLGALTTYFLVGQLNAASGTLDIRYRMTALQIA